MFKMPHRLFCCVFPIFLWHAFGVDTNADAQITILRIHGNSAFSVAEEEFEANRLQNIDPQVIKLIQKAKREIRAAQMIEFELDYPMLGHPPEENEQSKIIKEFDRLIAKSHPELYLKFKEIGFCDELIYSARRERDFCYLLLYKSKRFREALSIKQSQFVEIEKVIESLQEDLKSQESFCNSEMKKLFRSYYYDVRDCLSPEQQRKHDLYYGEPLMFNDKYVFLKPDGLWVNYSLHGPEVEYSKLVDVLDERLYAAYDPDKVLVEEEDIINQYTGTEFDPTHLSILGGKLIDIDEQKLAEIREILEAGKEIKYARFDEPYEVHRLRLMFEEKLVYAESLEKILSKKQLQRLAQLEFQSVDSHILDLGLFSEAVAGLNLSEQQVAEIRQKQVEVVAAMGKAHDEYRTAIEGPLTLAYERCEKVLDEQQLVEVTLKMDRKEFIARLVGRTIEEPAKAKAIDEK